MDAAPTPERGRRAWPGAGLRRLRARHPLAVQLARYALVGGAATALNAGLFLLFRPLLPAVPANLLSLTVTTALSTELNRRLAFGGARAHRLREWVQDLGTIAFYATYSSGVLLALQWLVGAPTPGQEAAAVAVASVGGGLLRFAVLRFWVFDLRDRRSHVAGPHDDRPHDDGPRDDSPHDDRPRDDVRPAGGPQQCSATSPPST